MSPLAFFFLRLCIDFGLIFGPVLGYILQLFQMRTTRNTDGYSLGVSIILLSSATLRVFYFFGHPFALALLFQALLMITVQLLLIVQVQKILLTKDFAREMMVTTGALALPHHHHDGATGSTSPPRMTTVKEEEEETGGLILNVAAEGSSSNSRTHHRGAPTRCVCVPDTPRLFLTRYCVAVFILSIFCWMTFSSSSTSFSAGNGDESGDGTTTTTNRRSSSSSFYDQLRQQQPFVELIGFSALGIESFLLVPQLMLNYQRQSTEGITPLLFFTWIFGDLAKLCYFLVLNQPFPFILCSCVQLSFDAIVVGQLLFYGGWLTYFCGVGNERKEASHNTRGYHRQTSHREREREGGDDIFAAAGHKPSLSSGQSSPPPSGTILTPTSPIGSVVPIPPSGGSAMRLSTWHNTATNISHLDEAHVE